MKTSELKSVKFCKSGSVVGNASTIFLVVGIILFIVFIVIGCNNDDAGAMFIYAVITLVYSITISCFGFAMAKMVNYIEAIYKNINSDFLKDEFSDIESIFKFGDKVLDKQNNKHYKIVTRDSGSNIDSYTYGCEDENGDIEYISGVNLIKVAE